MDQRTQLRTEIAEMLLLMARAEIIRAGISAVPRGQFEAARAIGMTRTTTMRVVVMPQALRIIIPPLGNAFNGLMKTSSLASVISMEELLRRTELLIQVQFKVLEIFIVAVGLLGLRYQGQQQILGRDLVVRSRQTTGALQFVGDPHGCIISPFRSPAGSPMRPAGMRWPR